MSELPPSRLRIPLLLLGAAAMGFGLWGSVFGTDTAPIRVAVLVVGATLAHDLLLAPVAVAVARWGRWLLPLGARSWLGGGLLVSAALVLVAVPVVGRFGARPDDPSLLPKDYGEGLAVALAVVWSGVALGAAASARLRRSRD